MRVDLKVPYPERQLAKKAGAKWDPDKRTWYWDHTGNLGAVMRWVPERLKAPCQSRAATSGNPSTSTKRTRVHRIPPSQGPAGAPQAPVQGGLHIWTDGSCDPNPGAGGWAFTASDGSEAKGGDSETTNNRMELFAILMAMRSLPDGTVVTIYSDSQYCVNGLTVWRAAWARRAWHKKDGSAVANRDLWMVLDAEQRRLQARFEWVRGHNGNPGNERADELAQIGRQQAIDAAAVWVA